MIPQRSTSLAQLCLTSEIGRDRVYSEWYDRGMLFSVTFNMYIPDLRKVSRLCEGHKNMQQREPCSRAEKEPVCLEGLDEIYLAPFRHWSKNGINGCKESPAAKLLDSDCSPSAVQDGNDIVSCFTLELTKESVRLQTICLLPFRRSQGED